MVSRGRLRALSRDLAIALLEVLNDEQVGLGPLTELGRARYMALVQRAREIELEPMQCACGKELRPLDLPPVCAACAKDAGHPARPER